MYSFLMYPYISERRDSSAKMGKFTNACKISQLLGAIYIVVNFQLITFKLLKPGNFNLLI